MPSQIRQDKSAVILEIGDVRTDGRCRNISGSLIRWGMRVIFIGPGDVDEEEEYRGIRIRRLAVLKRIGSKVMYVHFWIRSFWYSVQIRPTLVVAEDLYCLPAALMVKFFTGARILYDAKELYFAMASLYERPLTQRFWSAVERFCIRRADAVITSGERDSDLIGNRYGISRPITIHNHPPRSSGSDNKRILRDVLTISDAYTIFLYQGWLLRGRGLSYLLDIVEAIKDIFLVIIGDGVLRNELESSAREKRISDRVIFMGALPYEELLGYTAGADVGCALIEDYGLSYQHARPNKMFEYIQAHVPVLVSTMPAMEEVVNEWGVGLAVPAEDRSAIIQAAKHFIGDAEFYDRCVTNCKKAAEVFHWGEEEIKLFALLDEMNFSR
jgi:glycosyltransferase involved in cell wall biosynthesis